jgi:peptidoglycan/LPS O-acetylase OafA/YrhL
VSEVEERDIPDRPAPKWPGRILALDGLRGLAAFSVAIPHFFMEQSQGDWRIDSISVVAVEVFFVLSGFVLAPQLIYCMKRDSVGRIKIFWVRRWMRTLPPYLLALCAMAIYTGNLWTAAFVKYALFIQNFFAVNSRTDFFTIAWSLSVEEWFYLLFPPFLFLMYRSGAGFRKIVLAFFAIFLATKLVGAWLQPDWAETGRRIVAYRLDSICVGFGLYLFIGKLNHLPAGLVRLVSGIATLVSAVALAVVLAQVYAAGPLYWHFLYLYVVSAFGASVLIFFHFCEDAFRRHEWLGRLATLGGDISYDIYLFHLVILLVLLKRVPELSGALLLGVYLILVTGVSILVRRNFEEPILAQRPRYPSQPHVE